MVAEYELDSKIFKKENLDNSILYAPVKKIVPLIFPSIIKEDTTEELLQEII